MPCFGCLRQGSPLASWGAQDRKLSFYLPHAGPVGERKTARSTRKDTSTPTFAVILSAQKSPKRQEVPQKRGAESVKDEVAQRLRGSCGEPSS